MRFTKPVGVLSRRGAEYGALGVVAAIAALGAGTRLAVSAGRTPLDSLLALGLLALAGYAAYRIGAREERLLALVEQDPLTGLGNRARLFRVLAAELSRLERYASCFSLILIDLDRFKDLNDRQGHLAGDATLREIADVLRESARTTDTCVRFGGDEFAILAPETPREEALQLAERIRSQVQGRLSVSRGITLSVGVVDSSGLRSTTVPEEVLSMADAALYRAKRGGSDRVEVGAQLDMIPQTYGEFLERLLRERAAYSMELAFAVGAAFLCDRCGRWAVDSWELASRVFTHLSVTGEALRSVDEVLRAIRDTTVLIWSEPTSTCESCSRYAPDGTAVADP